MASDRGHSGAWETGVSMKKKKRHSLTRGRKESIYMFTTSRLQPPRTAFLCSDRGIDAPKHVSQSGLDKCALGYPQEKAFVKYSSNSVTEMDCLRLSPETHIIPSIFPVTPPPHGSSQFCQGFALTNGRLGDVCSSPPTCLPTLPPPPSPS